jgi:chemotaxis protein MotB
VLFDAGSAELGEAGRGQLAGLAAVIKDVAPRIPADLSWVLRVDGHTDRVPIRTAQFPSNWELSTARAISVVKFMIDQGVPADRLAATGFGEFQPLDPRDDETARRRNRRIEFKLTER